MVGIKGLCAGTKSSAVEATNSGMKKVGNTELLGTGCALVHLMAGSERSVGSPNNRDLEEFGEDKSSFL